jgi:sigma-B regulation protein RsbU (phosphoserine phosphatase)
MARNNDKYFTIWYGVFHRPTRSLNYASGGHHAAVLVTSPGRGVHLQSGGAVIGVVPELKFPSAQVDVPTAATLYVFSDGVYEIARPDESWQSREEFSQYLEDNIPPVETIAERARKMHGVEEFEDDFSLLQLKLS